jgi:hypothetical protein
MMRILIKYKKNLNALKLNRKNMIIVWYVNRGGLKIKCNRKEAIFNVILVIVRCGFIWNAIRCC